MSNLPGTPSVAPIQIVRDVQLRAEAAIEPDPVHTAPVASATQIIAIYGKGCLLYTSRCV